MNNAELIKALRHCGKGGDIAERCLPCGYYDCEPWCEAALVNDAADALEAAEKRIEELESVKCHCNVKENAELIARILDDDVDGNVYEMPKTGRWVYHDDDDMRFDTYHCSVCKKMFAVDAERFDDIGFVKEDLKYCPNCGARMKGGQE